MSFTAINSSKVGIKSAITTLAAKSTYSSCNCGIPISCVTEYNSAGENIGELYADGISGANIKMQTTQIKLEVAFVA